MRRTAAAAGLVVAWFGVVAAGQAPMVDSSPAASAGGSALSVRLSALASEPAVARDHWGVMVTALDGTRIASLNEGQLFQPASNAKLFTTAAAMALLGANKRFTTRVIYRQGAEDPTTVKTDVTILGDGDANLSGREIPYRSAREREAAPVQAADPLRHLVEFADEIAKAGVKRITGDIVGDDTVFPWEPYPEDWAVDDMVWGYGAPVSGLTVNDNQIKVTVRAGKTAAERPTVEFQPSVPGLYAVDVTGLRTSTANSGDHVQMERGAGSRVLRIYGTLAVDAAPEVEEIAIGDPAEFAAAALKMLLEARGIRVDGVARTNHRMVTDGVGFREESHRPVAWLPQDVSKLSKATSDYGSCGNVCPVTLKHTSPTVSEDITVTNKTSQNLHAELLLHHLGKSYGAPYAGGEGGVDGSTAEGVRVVRQFLINAGIDKDDFVFYDGSGLSGHDLVTPRATAKLLSFAAHDPETGAPQSWFAQWKASLPVGGVDGSLEARFPRAPLAGHVFAKTGTLGEARALSGYVDCASGRTVIFSIMVGNHPPGTNADRDAMDRMVAAIAAAL